MEQRIALVSSAGLFYHLHFFDYIYVSIVFNHSHCRELTAVSFAEELSQRHANVMMICLLFAFAIHIIFIVWNAPDQ